MKQPTRCASLTGLFYGGFYRRFNVCSRDETCARDVMDDALEAREMNFTRLFHSPEWMVNIWLMITFISRRLGPLRLILSLSSTSRKPSHASPCWDPLTVCLRLEPLGAFTRITLSESTIENDVNYQVSSVVVSKFM